MKKNMVFALVLSCMFLSSCGTDNKTNDVDVQTKENIAVIENDESKQDEIVKEDILSDRDIEYISEFDKILDKTITKISDTYDSTFFQK